MVARLSTALLTAASLHFLLLETRIVRSRGPIVWERPATVVSNSHPGQRPNAPFLLFLKDVRGLLPAGATVAVIGPNVRDTSAPLDDLVAIGQLPRNDVLPSWTAVQEGSAPRFLAVYRGTNEDARYRLFAILEAGRLYELRQ